MDLRVEVRQVRGGAGCGGDPVEGVPYELGSFVILLAGLELRDAPLELRDMPVEGGVVRRHRCWRRQRNGQAGTADLLVPLERVDPGGRTLVARW